MQHPERHLKEEALYKPSPEFHELDKQAEEFCREIPKWITKRDEVLLETIEQLIKSTRNTQSFSSFRAAVLDIVLSASGFNREPVLAEFRVKLMNGTFDNRWPSLKSTFDKLQEAIRESDQQVYTQFYNHPIGKVHAQLLSPGCGDYHLTDFDRAVYRNWEDFFSSQDGTELIDILIGNPSDHQQRLLFSIQKQLLEAKLQTSALSRQEIANNITGQIKHEQDVTQEVQQVLPNNAVAALAASVHDCIKTYLSPGAEPTTIVTHLGMHELLSAIAGSQLLIDVLREQPAVPDLLKTDKALAALRKVFMQLIFSHGPDHFPDVQSRNKPIYSETVPEPRLHVLFGSIYPQPLHVEALDPTLVDLGRTISAVDKWLGTTLSSLDKYNTLTTTQVVAHAGSLLNYLGKHTLASYLDCLDAPDVQAVYDEQSPDRIISKLKISLLIASVYLVSVPQIDINASPEYVRNQPYYSLKNSMIYAFTSDSPVAKFYRETLAEDTELQKRWQQITDSDTASTFFDSINSLVELLSSWNQHQFHLIRDQAQIVYHNFMLLRKLVEDHQYTLEKSNTRNKSHAHRLPTAINRARLDFNSAFSVLLKEVVKVDADNILKVFYSKHQEAQLVIDQALQAVEILTNNSGKSAFSLDDR